MPPGIDRRQQKRPSLNPILPASGQQATALSTDRGIGYTKNKEGCFDRDLLGGNRTMPQPSEIATVIDQLGRGPALVRQVIDAMPPELRKRRPAPGVWSAHEHAVHLPAVQPIMMRRLEQMLADPTQPIRSYAPSRDDPDDALMNLDLDAEMDRYQRERERMIERLQKLTPDEWAIAVQHDEYAQYSVFIMFRHLALHDLYHAYRIEERLLRKEWDT
jgi:hypothetical protein